MLDILEPVARFVDVIQKEKNIEMGATSSVISTSSVGNLSARSFGNMSSFLDVTTTVAGDLKEIICTSLLCVMRDFDPAKVQKNEVGGLQDIMENAMKTDDDGKTVVNLPKVANQVLTSVFTAASGVTNDNLRKNKIMECLKSIFQHRYAYAIPDP